MKTVTYNPETHVLVPREPEWFVQYTSLWDHFKHMGKAWIGRFYRSAIAAAPQPEPVESEPVAEHELQDIRCECCGYMTYHREHMGCIRSSTPQPDRTAELEAALKVARDALRDAKTVLIGVVQGDYDGSAAETITKINEVLKP